MNFRQLDLNLLVILDALLRERSTTAVARQLRISQPTVSASLARLRGFFGDALFVRSAAGMQPTPLAETLRAPVAGVIDIIRREVLRDTAFDPATSSRRFALSTSDIGELVFLPALMRATSQEAPGVTFQCLAMPPAALRAAMADGTIDMALGYFPDLGGAGFYEQRLFDHPFACIVRHDHPRVGTRLSLPTFLALDHIVVEQEGRSQEVFEQRMVKLGLSRRVALRSPHFMSVPMLIAQSDMIATLPHAVGTAFAGFARCRLLPPPIDIPRIPLKQCWHARVHTDPGAVWLRQLVARLFMNRDPTDAGLGPFAPASPL